MKNNIVCNTLNESAFKVNRNHFNVRTHDDYLVPFPRTDAIKINFNYRFPKALNTLPRDLKECHNDILLKHKLKTYIISSY